MKTFIFSLILIGFMAATATTYAQSSGEEPAEQAAQTQSQPDTLKFTVYGMDCPGCAGSLDKQVNKIQTVKSSQSNWSKQQLKVVMIRDSVLDLKALEKRVKKANFTLDKKSLKDKKDD